MSTISKLPFEKIYDCDNSDDPHNVASMTIMHVVDVPLLVDHHQKSSRLINDKSYFEKLRSAAEHPDRNATKSHPTMNQLDDMFENLTGSIQPCSTWNSDTTMNIESQVKILLARLRSLKKIHAESIQTAHQWSDTYTFPIMTSHGNILFDFSKQFVGYDVYIELMQLVHLSNLDTFIQKIFHKSGEYHHVDYRAMRQNQLKKEQENRDNSSDQRSHRVHQDLATSHSAPSIPKKYQLSHSDNLLKLQRMKKTNCCITMAKAVHFRRSTHCFVVDGIDISSRFQHDRNILRDTCLRFHNDSKQHILVLCTHQMKEIYRLLESLLKPYISSNISIVYVTFDQINQNTISPSAADLKKEFSTSGEVNDENMKTSVNRSSKTDNTTDKIDTSDEEILLDYFRESSLILVFMKHLDETYLTTFIRWYRETLLTSDQSLTSIWNKDIEHVWLVTSDYQRAQTVFDIPKTNLFLWPTEHNDFDHMSIIISSILILPIAIIINYQNYTLFIDGMSTVDKHCQDASLDRNVCIQMALLRIWSTICERKTIGIITCDDDLQHFGKYAQMLVTEYDHVNERTAIAAYTSIPLANMFLHEQNHLSYDFIAMTGRTQNPNIDHEPSSSSMTILSLTNLSHRNPNAFEFQKIPTEIEKISHPHSFISLDQLTPLTIGVLTGVYQMSIFFENIIRENVFQLNDQPPVRLSNDKILHSNL